MQKPKNNMMKQIVKATGACSSEYMHMQISSLTWLNVNALAL